MRKSLVLLVICLCMGGVCAAADPILPFTLRNGVTWGMTMEAFIGTEKFDDIEEDTLLGGAVGLLVAENVQVSEFEADLSGVFLQNELQMCIYDLDDLTEEEIEYLIGALTEKYDEPISTTDFLFQAMHRLVPDLYPENNMTQGKCWHLPNGTTVQFACVNEWDYGLAYMNYETLIGTLDELTSERYNLFGL